MGAWRRANATRSLQGSSKDDFVFATTVRGGTLTNIREHIDMQARARAAQRNSHRAGRVTHTVVSNSTRPKLHSACPEADLCNNPLMAACSPKAAKSIVTLPIRCGLWGRRLPGGRHVATDGPDAISTRSRPGAAARDRSTRVAPSSEPASQSEPWRTSHPVDLAGTCPSRSARNRSGAMRRRSHGVPS